MTEEHRKIVFLMEDNEGRNIAQGQAGVDVAVVANSWGGLIASNQIRVIRTSPGNYEIQGKSLAIPFLATEKVKLHDFNPGGYTT